MPGMAFMMDAYEQELKRPIRNVVNGQLPRTLLIQVHIVDHTCSHCDSASCYQFMAVRLGIAMHFTRELEHPCLGPLCAHVAEPGVASAAWQ
jgi:ATP synthase regulation protein NCA2